MEKKMNDVKTSVNENSNTEIALGIDKDGMTTARKLYEFLGLAKGQFSRWAKTNIIENPFAESGVDYKGFDIDIEGNKTTDYKLTTTFAKKLCMQGKTERAEQAMEYFIKVEDKSNTEETNDTVSNDLIKINDTELMVKMYRNQRVVTFKDIDAVHKRPEGTAKRNYRENKKHFIEGEDYYIVCADEIRTNKIMDISNKAHQDMVLITESGYLMIVKSFTDDLAWDVQRQLVKSYFRLKEYDENKESQQHTNNNTDIPHTLIYKGEPVITTSELARHYIVSHQNILQAFNKHKDYFEEGIHYFLLKAGEEVEFRKVNNLLISKSGKNNLYLWTRKGSLMFTKIIHSEVSWNQYKRILNILMDKIDDNINIHNICSKQEDKMQLIGNKQQFLLQDKWCVRNAYKIERVCNTLGMDKKEFNRMVITRIQEKYDMKSVEDIYVLEKGEKPKFAMDIIDCFPELEDIADNILMELIFSIMDRFSMMERIIVSK